MADDPELASEASTFLEKVNGGLPDVDVTAFAPAQEAWDSVPDLPEGMTLATVLNFHAVPELMDEGEGYATLAGADQGKLTINGDAVEGPCNTGNVVTTVDVCGSIVHVIDQVLLPGAACGKDDHDDEDHDHDDEDHDHDDEDHSEEDGGDEDEDDAEDDAAEDDDGGVLGGVLGDDGGVLGDDGGVEGEAEALFDAADDATEDAAAPAPTDLVGEAYRPDQNYQAEIESLEGDGTEADDTLQDIQQNNENNDNNSGATLDDVVNLEIVAEATAPAPAAPEENTAQEDLDYDVADESVGDQIDQFFGGR